MTSTVPTNLYPDIFPDLNVAELDVVTDAAGPGRRLVIWLQGCNKRCPGCANSVFLSAVPWRVLTVDTILTLALSQRVEGITLSGGEPVLQALALAPLLRRAREARLNVFCYSGYTLEELREQRDDALELFLGHVDVLVDGPYERSLSRGGTYRPSSNQRLHVFNPDGIAALRPRPVETQVTVRGDQAKATGTLPTTVLAEMRARLGALGVVWRPERPTGRGLRRLRLGAEAVPNVTPPLVPDS